jgi:hypothetical protein
MEVEQDGRLFPEFVRCDAAHGRQFMVYCPLLFPLPRRLVRVLSTLHQELTILGIIMRELSSEIFELPLTFP